MPDESTNQVEEVVVVVPDDSATPAATPVAANPGTGNPSDSGTVTEEIIDVILDPLGSQAGPTESAATPERVVKNLSW